MSEDKKYEQEFRERWANRGEDPESQRRVAEEFEDKFNETAGSGKAGEPGFRQRLVEMFEYMKAGEDFGDKALVVAALLYFISPIDIIPDIIPVVGYADDVAVIAFVYKQVKDSIQSFLQQRGRM